MGAVERSSDTSRVVAWVLGIAGTLVSAAIIASFALLLNVSGRLTVIETTISNNREERQSQINDLRDTDRDFARRIGQLERDGRRGR